MLPNIGTTNIKEEELVKKPITIQEAKKWFDGQKASSQSSLNGDSSLFQADPRWADATIASSQLGSEFLVAPLNLALTNGRCVSRLLVRRNPNGELSGRYLLYIPDENYRAKYKGVYNPSNFTGAVIYTDFYGHYSHGYSLVNGSVVGTATAVQNSGRGNAHSRTCVTVTLCVPVLVLTGGERCFDVIYCFGTNGSSGGSPTPGGWNDSPNQGTASSSSSGSSNSGGGSTWGNNQPAVVLGELTNEARQFLTAKGFTSNDMDYVSGFPDIAAQIFDYLAVDGSANAAELCKLHIKECTENSAYKFQNIQQKPQLGTEAWAMMLRFDEEPANPSEILVAIRYPQAALIVQANAELARQETVRRFGLNGTDDNSDAFRHAYWNAINSGSANVGQGVAKEFADAHETGGNNTEIARQMDLFNNDVGRNIGNGLLAIPIRDARYSNAIWDALNNGLLRRICQRGAFVIILIPTNQTC